MVCDSQVSVWLPRAAVGEERDEPLRSRSLGTVSLLGAVPCSLCERRSRWRELGARRRRMLAWSARILVYHNPCYQRKALHCSVFQVLCLSQLPDLHVR